MAEVLMELGEFRRAIAYCEATIQFHLDTQDAVTIAEALARAGKCYSRVGLRDHAAVPLRAAVKIYRTLAADPRFPSVLLDLGNALRKGAPEEAEKCYREVAEWHVARGQLESATPAWVNLGVLYNEAGRQAEALACYEKVLRVREQSRGTPPERMGALLNNIAGVHRRLRQFDQALDCADRSIQVLKPLGGHYLACAYGTRGMILRDAGRDAEAVAWFRKSSSEHRRQPSPNLETLCEELDNEASALERLGRAGEAAEARRQLAGVRASMAQVERSSVETGGLVDRLDPHAEGAVLIEFDFGGRAHRKGEVMTFLERLTVTVHESGVGHYGGYVMIPESTTVMLYGADAEALYASVESFLRKDPLCAGAKITIRQASRRREVFLPTRVM